jgi:hypothetical protein
MYLISISCMTAVVIYFLLIHTQLHSIHCLSHGCKKRGIPFFCSECKFQLPLFSVRFTNCSCCTVCFSVISIACRVRNCCLLSNVMSTRDWCNIRICVLRTFFRSTSSVLTLWRRATHICVALHG